MNKLQKILTTGAMIVGMALPRARGYIAGIGVQEGNTHGNLTVNIGPDGKPQASLRFDQFIGPEGKMLLEL